MTVRELQDEIIRLKKEKNICILAHAYQRQDICPEKRFYPLSKDCVCHNMQATTLADVYNAVKGIGGEEIVMSDELIVSSRKCIDEMLRLGK